MQEKLYNNPETSLKRRALCNDRTEWFSFFLLGLSHPSPAVASADRALRAYNRRHRRPSPPPCGSRARPDRPRVRLYRSRPILIVFSQIGPNPAVHVFPESLRFQRAPDKNEV